MAGIYRQWSCLQLYQVCQSASSSLLTLFGISASHINTIYGHRKTPIMNHHSSFSSIWGHTFCKNSILLFSTAVKMCYYQSPFLWSGCQCCCFCHCWCCGQKLTCKLYAVPGYPGTKPERG